MRKVTERTDWSADFTGKLRYYQPVFHDDNMKHFALIGPDNIVVSVNVLTPESCFDENNLHSETVGIEFCNKLWGTPDGHFWKETFKNDQGRGYYGVVGSEWDNGRQIFIIPQPHTGWILADDGIWESPTEKPAGLYGWDESTGDWAIIENYKVININNESHIYDDDGNLLEI